MSCSENGTMEVDVDRKFDTSPGKSFTNGDVKGSPEKLVNMVNGVNDDDDSASKVGDIHSAINGEILGDNVNNYNINLSNSNRRGVDKRKLRKKAKNRPKTVSPQAQ
ncbi:hypothetical protein Hanom_Chr12g01117371 [Helianthus anomalus]